jgi:hypothetical protein
MFTFKRHLVLQLRNGEFVRCSHRHLRVMQGCVWVTQANDPDDHFLESGQGLFLRAGALVGAEGVAQVTLEAAPTRLGALLRRLSRSGAAASSRTIAAWTCPPTN